MRIKIKRKSIRNVEKQILENKHLVELIHEAISYIEPDLTNEQLLERLVVMLTPMCDPQILNALHKFTNSLAEKKLDEIKELYSLFFDETEAPNNN